MVEIRPTGWSGLADLTWSGLVRPGPPRNRICMALWQNWHPILNFAIFITIYYFQIKCFLNKFIVSIDYIAESQESRSGNSALPRFGAVKIDSCVSNFFRLQIE